MVPPGRQIKACLGRLWPGRIWQQLFILLLLLAVVPLVTLGALLIHTSQRAVRTTVLRDHRELALRAAGQVSEFVRKPQELLVAVASIMGVSHANAWSQETAVVELSLRYPMLRRVASVGVDGIEVAVSQLGGAKLDRAQDVAFRKAREGGNYISAVQIHGTDTPVVTMAVPITQWGKVSGVLMAEVDLRGMWMIVDGIHVGVTGYACVVDRSGALISHPNKKMVLGHQTLESGSVVDQVLSGEGGSREDAAGGGWIISYAPIQDAGWGLLIFQSINEAYAFSRTMQMQSWFFITLVVFFAFVISLFLARYMGRPLNMLLEGMRRISHEDYDHPLPVSREDEVGQVLISFNAMVVRLKQAHQAEKLSLVGKAVTSIVHELKNSLVLVDTYIQLLGERYKERKFIQEFTRVVPQELSVWKGMLQNMVEYARVPQFSYQILEVGLLVRDVELLAQHRVKLHGCRFCVETGTGDLKVRGNGDKLRQVLMNLLSNALDSTHSCGLIRLAVAADDDVSGASVVISVENTGEGIPVEKIEKIFEPFFTTKDGGLGLGLAICRDIVKHHGGRLDVVSGQDGKTTFRVHLPLYQGS
ncbi:MAG: sensor histidine kinase [Candidatus Omnitrophota bacterium]